MTSGERLSMLVYLSTVMTFIFACTVFGMTRSPNGLIGFLSGALFAVLAVGFNLHAARKR